MDAVEKEAGCQIYGSPVGRNRLQPCMKELRVHGYEEGVSGMDQIQRILEDAVQSGQNAGCNLLVIKDGKEILYCESGFADVEQGKKIERNNISLFLPFSLVSTRENSFFFWCMLKK